MDQSNAHANNATPDFLYAEENNAGQQKAPPLTEEERQKLRTDLEKTEGEIATLRVVLQTRMKEANDLKRRLGINPWQEFSEDVTKSIKTVKESPVYHRTEEVLHQAGEKITSTLGQIRNSNAFKSFEDKMGSAYSNVKLLVSGAVSSKKDKNASANRKETVYGEDASSLLDDDDYFAEKADLSKSKISSSTSTDQFSTNQQRGDVPKSAPSTPMNEKQPPPPPRQ